MCGVVGVFNYADPERKVDEHLLRKMTRALAHRGPDDEGLFIDHPIGFGHRRLSIVDLTATGKQPMSTPDGAHTIVFNGEFYNHGDFRDGLTAHGTAFRGTSDTETLLHLLRRYGPTVLAEVAGIFGFGFWDAAGRRLILARDPAGVKQLYYHDDGRRVVFASEIKALLVDPTVPREPDLDGLNDYVHFHTTLFRRTFFAGVRQVRAGEYVEFTAHGAREKAYWQPDGFEPRHEQPRDQLEQLRALVAKVVREQLMSDVPVGCFFSGGIDSSTVAAYALASGKRPRCYGVHFSNQGVIDERSFQESAAAAIGVELALTTYDGARFPDDLLRLMYFQDQPVVGAAMFPMYEVSKLAARDVKVCLGGQAADELFGGYARYALVDPLHVARSWVSARARGGGANGPAATTTGAAGGTNLTKQMRELKTLARLGRALGSGVSWRKRYFNHFAPVPPAVWRATLAEPRAFARSTAYAQFEQFVDASAARTPLGKVLHWESATYLTALFHQDDRMSMANGLESRVPLADPRMMRFAFHTPDDLKLHAGATKWLLRQAVADVIPREVLTRRKAGFDTPAEGWMRGPHLGFVRDLLLSRHARERGLFDPTGVERLLADQTHPYWFQAVWKLTCIEAWARVMLDRAAVAVAADPLSMPDIERTPAVELPSSQGFLR